MKLIPFLILVPLVLALVALVIGGLIQMFSPEGYEDETGFHLGADADHQDKPNV